MKFLRLVVLEKMQSVNIFSRRHWGAEVHSNEAQTRVANRPHLYLLSRTRTIQHTPTHLLIVETSGKQAPVELVIPDVQGLLDTRPVQPMHANEEYHGMVIVQRNGAPFPETLAWPLFCCT
jgi:hypothetical protein